MLDIADSGLDSRCGLKIGNLKIVQTCPNPIMMSPTKRQNLKPSIF